MSYHKSLSRAFGEKHCPFSIACKYVSVVSGFGNRGLPNCSPGFSVSACHNPLGPSIKLGGAGEKHGIVKPCSRHCRKITVGCRETVASLGCAIGVCAVIVDAVYPVILVALIGTQVNIVTPKQHSKVDCWSFCGDFLRPINYCNPRLPQVFASENPFAFLVVVTARVFASGNVEVAI